MTKELEEDIEHELKWMNSPCRATREEARANLFKIINNLEKPTCNTCKYNTVGQDEYIWGLEEQVKELEKENAEAKERIKTLEYRCENIKDTDTMELVALQRENAELKEKLNFSTQYYQGEKAKEQLTKAKEILKAVVDFYPTMTATILLEAEQFLKDNEVEK